MQRLTKTGTAEDGKNIAWCEESQFLQHADGRVRDWYREYLPGTH